MALIEKVFKEKNIKMTQQRRRIIHLFLNYEAHFKPEEVYGMVKKEKIGLATVYRTIEILKRHDIIEEISIGKDRYYELKIFSEKRVHIHFQCQQCNRLYDYAQTKMVLNLLQLRNEVERAHNVKVKDMTIIMNGLCKNCRR